MSRLSTDEVLDARQALEQHQQALHPHFTDTSKTNDFMARPDRWNGTRGANPITESERKLLEAAERNAGRNLTFSERMELLHQLRADMPNLRPPAALKKVQ